MSPSIRIENERKQITRSLKIRKKEQHGKQEQSTQTIRSKQSSSEKRCDGAATTVVKV